MPIKTYRSRTPSKPQRPARPAPEPKLRVTLERDHDHAHDHAHGGTGSIGGNANYHKPDLTSPYVYSEKQFVPVEELEKGLPIDRDALDDALFEQPDIFYRVTQALTYAISMRDAATQELKETMAETANEMRSEAARFEEKVTDKAVEAAVGINKDVLAVQRKVQHWTLQAARYQALKEAFGQRSYVLRELVQLWLAGYFGDAVEKRRNSPLRQRMGEEAREGRGENYKGVRA